MKKEERERGWIERKEGKTIDMRQGGRDETREKGSKRGGRRQAWRVTGRKEEREGSEGVMEAREGAARQGNTPHFMRHGWLLQF